ncbi:hypothetical protein [Serratia marcescens]|uniref:hypothetical protein n=2 Tax=Serratia marcescens TaxID=615 RepID=UPI001EFA11EE|nr:hypothetical protein [Serratia marcescens]
MNPAAAARRVAVKKVTRQRNRSLSSITQSAKYTPYHHHPIMRGNIMKCMPCPSVGTSLANGISGGAGVATKLSGATSGSSFMSQMQSVQAEMQQNQVDKAKMDAENQRINGIADSAAQAGSAAAQIKIQY